MENLFKRVEELMNDEKIQEISVMKNKVWISKTNQTLTETQMQLNIEEVYKLIHSISKNFTTKPNEKKPIWRGRTENGFIVDIVMPPVSFELPVITLYKEELFSGNFYNY